MSENLELYNEEHQGSWVDDGEILLEKWEIGMNIRAVKYCQNEFGLFGGM